MTVRESLFHRLSLQSSFSPQPSTAFRVPSASLCRASHTHQTGAGAPCLPGAVSGYALEFSDCCGCACEEGTVVLLHSLRQNGPPPWTPADPPTHAANGWA